MTVFFKVKRSARTLQLISVKVSSMSSVLGHTSLFLLEAKSLLYPVGGVTCPEFAFPSIHDKSQFDFKFFTSVMIAIKVTSHSHGSTQCQVNFFIGILVTLSLLFTYCQLYFYLSVIYFRR